MQEGGASRDNPGAAHSRRQGERIHLSDEGRQASERLEQARRERIRAEREALGDADEREPRVNPRIARQIAEDEQTDAMNAIIDSDGTNEEKIAGVVNLLQDVSPHDTMSGGMIAAVVRSGTELDDFKALDYLVNRILSSPLDAETSSYHLSFYADINLTNIREAVRSAFEKEPDVSRKRQIEAQYTKIGRAHESVAFAHEMNRKVIMGDLQGLTENASVITPENLQAIQDIRGVSTVMRLLDTEYQRICARDGYVSGEAQEEIIGKAIETRTVTRQVMGDRGEEVPMNFEETTRSEGSVEKLLREINDRQVGNSHLDEWEIRWALNLGRDLYNISLRGAELISLGVNYPGISERYASFPQENAARLMNWMGLMGKRFEPGGPQRGSIKIMDMMIENYQNDRALQGYGPTSIERIAGQSLAELEYAGMFGVTGIWSSWRQDLIILEQSPVAGGNMSMREFLKGIQETPSGLRAGFLDENGNLKREFSNSLGVILKLGKINPQETDPTDVRKAKEEVRAAIWKRVAQDNPLAIANFINKSKLKGGAEFVLDKDVWRDLSAKLNKLHELRMQRIRGGDNIPLADIIREEAGRDGGIILTDVEEAMLLEIQGRGSALAGEFANIRFPFNPFMNDVVYESIEYGKAGAEFFRRRQAGDLGSFNSAYTALIKIIDNPGGMHKEDVLKNMHEIVQGIGSPLGTGTGQDKVMPFLEAYLDFIEEGGQYKRGDPRRWLVKQALYAGYLRTRGTANSLAQEYAGPAAEAENELELWHTMQVALNMGIIRKGRVEGAGVLNLINRMRRGEDVHLTDIYGQVKNSDLYERLRRKHGTKARSLIMALLRDWLIFVVIGAGVELGKEVKNAKD